MNDLQDEVKDGYILYLDDDDILSSSNSLSTIAKYIKNENSFLMWRVKFPDRLVPSDNNFGKAPVVRDIDTIGFLFHNKYKQKWEPYKRGDYRVAIKLYNLIPNKIFINQILTELQRSYEGGNGNKDDKKQKNQLIQEQVLQPQPDTPREPVKITRTLEKTKKEINYDRVNQIFNGQKIHTETSKQKTFFSNEKPTNNTQMLQKLMGKKKFL